MKSIPEILKEWMASGKRRRLSFSEANSIKEFADHNPDEYLRLYREAEKATPTKGNVDG